MKRSKKNQEERKQAKESRKFSRMPMFSTTINRDISKNSILFHFVLLLLRRFWSGGVRVRRPRTNALKRTHCKSDACIPIGNIAFDTITGVYKDWNRKKTHTACEREREREKPRQVRGRTDEQELTRVKQWWRAVDCVTLKGTLGITAIHPYLGLHVLRLRFVFNQIKLIN